MGFILGFFAAALMAGTGIYNPKFMHNGHPALDPLSDGNRVLELGKVAAATRHALCHHHFAYAPRL